MARKRATMREGPLAELFRTTEAAQRAPEGPRQPRPRPIHAPRPRSTRRSSTSRLREEPEPEPAPAPTATAAPVEVEPEPDAVTAEAAASRAAARYFADASLEPAPQLRRVPPPKGVAYLAAIRVVGVGGAGLNAIQRMMDAGIAQVDFVAVNTDRQPLAISDAPIKIAHRRRAHARVSARAPIRVSAGVPPRRRSTSSRMRFAARTWCSSRRERAAAPGPARRRSSRGSPASSAR